jgi:hypothetical protein
MNETPRADFHCTQCRAPFPHNLPANCRWTATRIDRWFEAEGWSASPVLCPSCSAPPPVVTVAPVVAPVAVPASARAAWTSRPVAVYADARFDSCLRALDAHAAPPAELPLEALLARSIDSRQLDPHERYRANRTARRVA